jgi:polyhydroxyalkanoate synthesis regulator phasin
MRDHLMEAKRILREALTKTQNISRNLEDKIKHTVGNLAETAVMQVEIRKLRQRVHYLEKKLKVYER